MVGSWLLAGSNDQHGKTLVLASFGDLLDILSTGFKWIRDFFILLYSKNGRSFANTQKRRNLINHTKINCFSSFRNVKFAYCVIIGLADIALDAFLFHYQLLSIVLLFVTVNTVNVKITQFKVSIFDPSQTF